MKELKVKVTLTEEMLGTASNNPDIHSEYIASKAPDAKSKEEEIEAIGVDAEIEKSMTVFPRNKAGQPIMWDYQVKGFFKDACGMLRNVKGSESSKVKAYKKKIDGLIFVKEREIPIQMSGQIGNCQRPLRAQTMQGERVALANSETVPAGTWFECDIVAFDDKMWAMIEEWLNYGQFNGLGQWRSSGKGAFTWQYAEAV
jgi:hypothetical protein